MSLCYEIIDFFRTYTMLSVVARMLLSVLCGGIIGMERGRHGRAAGLRTHILISLGAAMSAIVGLYTTEILGYTNDPLRVGAQVVSGIGFIGVGSILVVGRSHVRGLTTAAGLWSTAVIGISCGVGFVLAATVATMIVSLTMTVMARLEASSNYENNTEHYYIELCDLSLVDPIAHELRNDFHADDVRITTPRSHLAGHIGIEVITLRTKPTAQNEELSSLQHREGVVMAVHSW